MKMKILILAIVLCAVDGQIRGYSYGRQSYNGYARQDSPESQTVDDTTVTGEQMMLFLIKTLKNLQALFESYQWDDLYQRPDTTMQLPNKFQERRGRDHDHGQSGWNSLDGPAQRPAAVQPGTPPGKQLFPPPPPLSRGRPRSRRSEDVTFRGHDPKIMPARPIRTTTTTTTTTRRPTP